MNCSLCSSEDVTLFDQDKKRTYFKCGNCSLIFVPRDLILSSVDEKSRYDSHENSENDPEYRKYLSEIVQVTIPYLSDELLGLDFGCGKTTLLSQIYFEEEIKVDNYDLYFHPDEKIWQRKYDFIVLSEVIEHLRDPLETIRRLFNLLNSNGQFFIKTKFYPEDSKDFSNWFYKRDVTHVQFFNQKSVIKFKDLFSDKMNIDFLENDIFRLS